MNPYDTLGVDHRADETTINKAYRELAKRFHPDQHPEVAADERSHFEQTMRHINEAYNLLKSPDRRREYDLAQETHADESSYDDPYEDLRLPNYQECTLCGSSPASPFTFEHQHAYLLTATKFEFAATMCRDCATATGRAKQNRTLWAGWWGIISLFRNLYVVWINGRELLRAQQMQRPKSSKDHLLTPFDQPLSVGQPVLGRFGFWVPVMIIAGLVAIGAFAENDTSTRPPPPRVPPPPTRTVEQVTWAVGNCVRGFTLLEPVPCSQPNNGRIVADRFSPQSCPMSADSYVEIGTRVWCIASTP